MRENIKRHFDYLMYSKSHHGCQANLSITLFLFARFRRGAMAHPGRTEKKHYNDRIIDNIFLLADDPHKRFMPAQAVMMPS